MSNELSKQKRPNPAWGFEWKLVDEGDRIMQMGSGSESMIDEGVAAYLGFLGRHPSEVSEWDPWQD